MGDEEFEDSWAREISFEGSRLIEGELLVVFAEVDLKKKLLHETSNCERDLFEHTLAEWVLSDNLSDSGFNGNVA